MGEDLEHAGRAIEAVRFDRGLTQAEAAAAAGVSGTSWNIAANGRERLSPRIAGKVMRWCGWTADSYGLLVEGKKPRPLKDAPSPPSDLKAAAAGAEEAIAELRARVDALTVEVARLQSERGRQPH